MAAKNLHIMMTASADKVTSAVQSVENTMQKLKASTSGMRAAFASIVGGANPFDLLKGGVKNLIGEIPGIGPALQGGLGIAESFLKQIRTTQKEIQGVGKAASAVGASVEGYSGLRYIASDAEALDKAMFKLSDNIAEAAMGGGSVDEAFKRIGLDAAVLSGMKTDEAFLKIAGALSKVGNSALRNKTAMDIFGKGALGVMGEIMRGEEGLRKGMKMAKEHGAIISDADVAAVKQANLAMKQFDASIDGVWRRLAVSFAPVIKSVAEDLKGLNVGEGGAGGSQDKLGTSLLQWKYMFEDFGSFLQGDWSGPSALTRAQTEMAKFQRAIDEATKKAKQEQEQLKRAAEEQKKLTDEAARQAEIMKRTDAVVQAGLGPMDKFQQKLTEINAVMAMGQLTVDQYDMALGALIAEFDKLAKAKEDQLRGPELIEFGSSAASSFETRFDREGLQAQGDAQERAVRVLEQIRDAQKDQVKTSKEAAAALRRLGLAKA